MYGVLLTQGCCSVESLSGLLPSGSWYEVCRWLPAAVNEDMEARVYKEHKTYFLLHFQAFFV